MVLLGVGFSGSGSGLMVFWLMGAAFGVYEVSGSGCRLGADRLAID